ncbi:hypothetical protein V6N13_071669 [Hibiscus sabdariffa]|uniref:ARID domain-containing protein n=1 Tax=Hibiscus sabdariffa TaxID=183260 RepID=A0ABR2TCQ4_9ROSI
MFANGLGINDKQRRCRGQSNEKEPEVSYFPALDSRTKNPHDLTVCPLCLNKMEDPTSCVNTLLLCPHCNDILLVSENSQGKFLSPISSDIPGPKHVPPVCTPRQQYDLALDDPRYFHIMRELVSTIKGKPFRAPVIFRKKELNVHRMFIEVTCRGGILKVTQERRLQEVPAALAENLSVEDLFKIYMLVLYDLESCLCNFPPAPPLRPCTSYMPRLRHPSQWIQASDPNTNAAPVNKNQQWTRLPAGFNDGYTDHMNRLSSGPCPMSGVTLKGGQPSSSNMNPAVTYNNPMWISKSFVSNYYSNFDSAGHCSSSHPMPYPTGSTPGWIEASAPYTNSVPVKNNQQTGVNFGSIYHPNVSSDLSSAIENDNQVWVTASDFNFNSGLNSEDHTLSSLPTPHPTQGLIGREASEQGIHNPSQNQRMMVKRKLLTDSLEPMKKTRMLSSLPDR